MEHLIIRNFGPITDIDIVLKKLNVFIGEQGVGKSTIAKLLSCLRDVSLYNAVMDNRNDVVRRIFSIYGIQDYFKADTYIEYFDGNEFTVKYKDKKFDILSSEKDRKKLHIFIGRVMDQ